MQRHLLIGGTGRAGTSFLVRYLTEAGLDTHIARNGAASEWDGDAEAGLENVPLLGNPTDLPYVIKSPWLFQYVDQLIAREDITIDGVILPIRDLAEAAGSRIMVEYRKIHSAPYWPSELEDPFEQWGLTPGGALFSLNPLDEGRLLAVGQHKLIERLVKAGIRFGFVHFPRLISDPDHLYRQIKTFLPKTFTIQQARAAHKRVADPAKVRVEIELKAETASEQNRDMSPDIKYPGILKSDNVALKREIKRMREERQKAESLLVEGAHALDHARTHSEALRATISEQTARAEHAEALHGARSEDVARLTHERDAMVANLTAQADHTRLENEALQVTINALTARAEHSEALHGARSEEVARLTHERDALNANLATQSEHARHEVETLHAAISAQTAHAEALHSTLSGEIARVSHERNSLAANLAAQAAHARLEIEALRHDATKHIARATQANHALNRAHASLRDAQARVAALESDVAAFLDYKALVEGSLSWKITEPLRGINRVIRRTKPD